MAKLDSNVRTIALQFSFTNPEAIPVSVKHRNPETVGERVERKSHSSGILVISPAENTDLVRFLSDIEDAGYELVDAFYKERIDGKDPRSKRTYHVVRFLFARRDLVNLTDEFRLAQDVVRAELALICESAMWRVRAFLNPFYEKGEEVSGQHTVSVNLEARQPLFRPDGQPVTVWQKDETGRRIGEAPMPIKAKQGLRLDGTELVLVSD